MCLLEFVVGLFNFFSLLQLPCPAFFPLSFPYAAAEITIHCKSCDHYYYRIQNISPCCLPPGRIDYYFECCTLLIPYTFIIRGLHPKGIYSRGQLWIKCHMLIADIS